MGWHFAMVVDLQLTVQEIEAQPFAEGERIVDDTAKVAR